MSTRKALTALAAVTATIALSAAPAYAESFQTWVHQTNSHYERLAEKMEQAGKSQDQALIISDINALVAYGNAHPPPGRDRADFLTAMNYLNQVHQDAAQGAGQAVEQDLTDASYEFQDCPQRLPGWWTTGKL